MSTHNLCFEQKYKKYQNFCLKIFNFFGGKIFSIFEKACFRNGLPLTLRGRVSKLRRMEHMLQTSEKKKGNRLPLNTNITRTTSSKILEFESIITGTNLNPILKYFLIYIHIK